ncbi:MAG: ABC transporter permease [Nakamurella sp.]
MTQDPERTTAGIGPDQLTRVAPSSADAAPDPGRRIRRLLGSSSGRLILAAAVLFVVLSIVRVITGADELTAPGTVSATLRLSIPLLLAGLAGLWAERVGIVNIGIEGMMILGTWFGAYGAWKFGPWTGILLGIAGGALGGLIHATATVKFNVDHVISGVAINILALGATQYLSEIFFNGQPGGGVSKSPPQLAPIQSLTAPYLAGGAVGGQPTSDLLGSLYDEKIPVISDAAGVVRGVLTDLSWATIAALLLVPLTAFILWRTAFGLRLRSSGEAPAAAESLGVRVIRLRYLAMTISGGLAGFGGAFLAIVASSAYREGQTANRGYIGLAIMIFGNWRPAGLLGGASLFGFTDALQLLGKSAIPALFLFVAIVLVLIAGLQLSRGRKAAAAVAAACGVGFLVLWLTVDALTSDLVAITPYVVTLLVLAVASQRLRPPAHAGLPYRSGDNH